MVQILERGARQPTTGQRFLDAFANAGQAVPGVLEQYQKYQGSKNEKISKNLAGLSGFLPKELKARGRSSLADDPRQLAMFREKLRPLIEAGYDPYEAFEQIYSDYEKQDQTSQSGRRESGDSLIQQLLGGKDVSSGTPGKFSERNQGNGHPYGLAGEFLEPGIKAAKNKPSLLASELPIAAIKSAENWGALHDPMTSMLQKLIGKKEQPSASGLLGQKLRKGLSPEDTQGAERISDVESILVDLFGPNIYGKVKGLLGRAGKAISPSAILPAEKTAAQRLLTHTPKIAEEAAVAGEKSLAGRVAKAEPSAIEMRVARTKPEQRIYPRTQNIIKRESQLKSFPKYEAEIAQDAADRAKRAESRIPKTVKGMESKKLRAHEAEKQLPAARESYTKSAARVRALEDELAKYKGPEKDRMKQLLELSKKDLENAESNLIGRLENTKGISYRATAEEMQQAARKKMLDIADTIASGEEVKLGKMDYSPGLISEAKRIAKKKPLPTTRHEDFYTKTHDRYIDEYKNQLARIEKEIKNLPKSMVSVEQARNLNKEKDALGKMIQSAEAENAIHRHKFALREMSERHKAKERIATFQKQTANPKVQKAAEQKMWKQRIEDIKTSEGRSKVAAEITEEAAKEAKIPAQAQKIRSEKGKLNEALDELNKIEEKIKDKIKSSPSPKEAKQKSFQIVDDFQDMLNGLKKGGLEVFKTKLGQDIVTGVAAAFWDDIRKDYDIPITGASAIAIASGGYGRRGVYRGIANQLTKYFLKEAHIGKAVKAYKSHDDVALKEFSPSIKKKAKERAFG